MLDAAGTTVDSTYQRVLIAMVLMGGGMGLASAPATESIMGSLPREKAGVGSAVNDTTRELGGALGVAIVGSTLSSLYATRLAANLRGKVPAPALTNARESVGGDFAVAHQVGGPVGAEIIAGARDAFVHAMSRASLLTALFALAGAAVALRFLPARAGAEVIALEPSIQQEVLDPVA